MLTTKHPRWDVRLGQNLLAAFCLILVMGEGWTVWVPLGRPSRRVEYESREHTGAGHMASRTLYVWPDAVLYLYMVYEIWSGSSDCDNASMALCSALVEFTRCGLKDLRETEGSFLFPRYY